MVRGPGPGDQGELLGARGPWPGTGPRAQARGPGPGGSGPGPGPGAEGRSGRPSPHSGFEVACLLPLGLRHSLFAQPQALRGRLVPLPPRDQEGWLVLSPTSLRESARGRLQRAKLIRLLEGGRLMQALGKEIGGEQGLRLMLAPLLSPYSLLPA